MKGEAEQAEALWRDGCWKGTARVGKMGKRRGLYPVQLAGATGWFGPIDCWGRDEPVATE